jgi:hypothetical protein
LGPGDCIGLIFKTYTETQVIFTFGSSYRQSEYAPIHTGDEYTVNLRGLSKSGTVESQGKESEGKEVGVSGGPTSPSRGRTAA